jgi:chromosome segregation ATPase
METSSKESRIKYVDELANAADYPPGDAWISITDAARVTRTSEAMARRWVTSGRLPIKPGDYGIPPRTRLVRLSDVAKIRPIVDPTAAISDDTRKLDLPSIPRQQAQIMQDHQHLLVETGKALLAVEQLKEETRKQLEEQLDLLKKQCALINTLEERLNDLSKLVEETSNTVTTHGGTLEQLTTELTTLQGQLQQARAELAANITEASQAQQTRLQEATTRLDTRAEAQERTLTEISSTLATAQAAIEQTRQEQAALEKRQKAAQENQTQALRTEMAQQAHDLAKELQQLESDQAKDIASINSQIESINTGLDQANSAITAARQIATGSQTQARAQESRITELQQELEDERSARRILEQQLAALTQRVNALSSEPGKPTGRERRK